MRIRLAGLLIGAMMFVSCSKVEEAPIVISTDTWIGATPLYYAHAKGWLHEAHIEMLQTQSINENMRLYENKASDVVTGTQHEYKRLKKTHAELIPFIVYDRSLGGDVILANQRPETIAASKSKIHVYLESDTISTDMLEYFIKEHRLEKGRIEIYNRSHTEIAAMTPSTDETQIVITYHPHDISLKKNGFQEVANSRKPGYLVLDGFYVSKEFYDKHSEQLMYLYRALEDAQKAYWKDPKEFYETTKIYLGNPDYKEFQAMLSNIEWLNNATLDASLLQQMEEIGVPANTLIGRQQQ